MKVLYFDCFSGISGDMTLGALIDLGIDTELFKSELDKLNLAGYEIVISRKEKNGIWGTDVHVILNEEYDEHRKKVMEHMKHGHDHEHDHHHHTHEHHNYHEKHGHNEHHGHHSHTHNARNLKDIEELIDSSDLSRKVKEFSKKVFGEIARAEAKVHNKGINEVHFHEVGAIDSIVDIVGTAICLDLLGIDKVFSSPLREGTGFIRCQHGMLPVPVPAVMEILANSKIPIVTEDINTELVTPTGIGVIKCLASSFGNMPAMIIEKIGYGMGKRDTGRLNALRIVMGTLFEEDKLSEEIAVLETNIDDMSSEILGYTMECLLENGALDVYYTPIYMKKNRPAVMLTVLTDRQREEKMADIIFRETSTLGIRKTCMKRYCMDREIRKISTEYGDVRVKVALKGEIQKFAPEYEDCKEIARRTGMTLSSVYDLVREKVCPGFKAN